MFEDAGRLVGGNGRFRSISASKNPYEIDASFALNIVEQPSHFRLHVIVIPHDDKIHVPPTDISVPNFSMRFGNGKSGDLSNLAINVFASGFRHNETTYTVHTGSVDYVILNTKTGLADEETPFPETGDIFASLSPFPSPYRDTPESALMPQSSITWNREYQPTGIQWKIRGDLEGILYKVVTSDLVYKYAIALKLSNTHIWKQQLSEIYNFINHAMQSCTRFLSLIGGYRIEWNSATYQLQYFATFEHTEVFKDNSVVLESNAHQLTNSDYIPDRAIVKAIESHSTVLSRSIENLENHPNRAEIERCILMITESYDARFIENRGALAFFGLDTLSKLIDKSSKFKERIKNGKVKHISFENRFYRYGSLPTEDDFDKRIERMIDDRNELVHEGKLTSSTRESIELAQALGRILLARELGVPEAVLDFPDKLA